MSNNIVQQISIWNTKALWKTILSNNMAFKTKHKNSDLGLTLLLWNYTNLNSIKTPMKKLHNGAFTRRMCQQSNKVQFQEDIKLWWKEINFEIKKEKKLNSQFPNFLWSEFRNPNAPSMKNTTPSNQVIKQTKNWTNPNKLSTPTLHICFRKKTEVLNYMKHQKKELTHHEKYHKEK